VNILAAYACPIDVSGPPLTPITLIQELTNNSLQPAKIPTSNDIYHDQADHTSNKVHFVFGSVFVITTTASTASDFSPFEEFVSTEDQHYDLQHSK
jgi:hypothetical protein